MEEPSAVEVVVRLGAGAISRTDVEDGCPPILWIRAGLVDIMITPFAASEDGDLTKGDLDLAADLVAAAVAYRDAISGQLAKTEPAGRPVTARGRRTRPRAPRTDADPT